MSTLSRKKQFFGIYGSGDFNYFSNNFPTLFKLGKDRIISLGTGVVLPDPSLTAFPSGFSLPQLEFDKAEVISHAWAGWTVGHFLTGDSKNHIRANPLSSNGSLTIDEVFSLDMMLWFCNPNLDQLAAVLEEKPEWVNVWKIVDELSKLGDIHRVYFSE